MAQTSIKPTVNLDQWANGAAPDRMVSSGSQADQWQNGNLGAAQAHYAEGESVPYRAVLNNLQEGAIYWVTLQWDTTKSGVHALDYINSYNDSFPAGRNETVPVPTQGVVDPLGSLSLMTAAAIPTDPMAIDQESGQIMLFGGATFLNYVLPGADGVIGTADDNDAPTNPYSVSGAYSGTSSTSLTLKFQYTGDGDATLGEFGSAVVAWGGHIATRADWGDGNSAAAISGSPYHTRLTGFADNNPNTAESVGNQDRSLSSAAVTFPGEITVTKQTTPDGNTTEEFDFELTRPANTVDVIGGLLDASGDGIIDGRDDGRFTDSGGEVFLVTDGSVADTAGGDGLVNSYAIVAGGLDINGSNSVTIDDKLTNLAGTGVATFMLKDGQSMTFGGLLDFGAYTVAEVGIGADWDLTSINTSRTDINGATTNATINNPSGDQATITLAEADQWTLTYNDAFIARPGVSIAKTVSDVDGGGSAASADEAGDVLTYAIAVGNTGNVALSSVSVTDQVEGYSATGATFTGGDANGNSLLDLTETWTYSATYTVLQGDLDGRGGGDSDLDNTATVTTGQTGPQQSSATVPLAYTPSLGISKTPDRSEVGANEVINYGIVVTNTGNITLTGITLADPLLANEAYASGDTDLDGKLDVGEAWSYTGSYTVSQAVVDNDGVDANGAYDGDGDVDNTATADSNETLSASASAVVPLRPLGPPSIDVEKFVSVDGGATWIDADNPTGPVLLSGTNPQFKFVVTGDAGLTLTNVVLSDSDFDLNGAAAGGSVAIGTLAPGQTYEQVFTGATFQAGQHTNTASVVGTTVLGAPVQDADDANYFGFSPITITGNPQFNFPNDLEKIQPKLQGADSFIINPLGYISWDMFTSDNMKASIDTTANFLSTYPGLTVSIQEIWNSVSIGSKASGADAIYRIYVANESDAAVALDNSHNIVEYDIVASSTDKGLIDLINADPLIGNFNSFSNIENAVGKAGNGFTTGSSPVITAGFDKIWSSPSVTGTAVNETPAPAGGIDGLGGNDAIYGRNNAAGTTELLSGGAGADMVDGRDGRDTVSGGAGNDYLFGSLGADSISGGDGNDILFGGYGPDSLTGNAGSDTFILRMGDFETITDFDVTAGAGDTLKIWLESLDNTAASGSYVVDYDEANGILLVDGTPVVQLIGTYTEAQVLAHLVLT